MAINTGSQADGLKNRALYLTYTILGSALNLSYAILI